MLIKKKNNEKTKQKQQNTHTQKQNKKENKTNNKQANPKYNRLHFETYKVQTEKKKKCNKLVSLGKGISSFRIDCYECTRHGALTKHY